MTERGWKGLGSRSATGTSAAAPSTGAATGCGSTSGISAASPRPRALRLAGLLMA